MEDIRFNNLTKTKLSEFNLQEVRGWMIDRLYQIEILIDNIISDYYEPKKKEEFKRIILNSNIINIGGKIKILSNIEGIDYKIIKNLRDFTAIRNYFAHLPINEHIEVNIIQEKNKNDLDSVSAVVTQNIYVMNAEGKIKEKNANEQIQLFFNLNDEITRYLRGYLN